AAVFMPFAASHWATVSKTQLAMPETSLRQTGEACPNAAGAAIKAAMRLDEAISVRMRNSLDAPQHNGSRAGIVPNNKGQEYAFRCSRLAGTPIFRANVRQMRVVVASARAHVPDASKCPSHTVAHDGGHDEQSGSRERPERQQNRRQRSSSGGVRGSS